MTKVLHIYKSYFPETYGGIEQSIHTLSAATAELGIENTLLTTKKINTTEKVSHARSLHIIRTPSNFTLASCPFSYAWYTEFKRISPHFHCLHLHFPWPFAELVTRFTAQPQHNIIITYHADITRQKYLKWLHQPTIHSLFRRAQHIVTTSPNLRDSSLLLQQYAHKTSVIPLSLNLQDYPAATTAELQTWQQRVGNNFLLFIGQFRHYKGIHILLQALQNLNIPCVLIGDGEYKAAAEALAKELKLTQVYFVGSVSNADKIALLELSHAVVLPSIARSEAFGIALLEGLAFGKPLISTELGTGTSYVNQHGITGIVVPPKNPQALRQAIVELFFNQQLYIQLTTAAQRHFQQQFQKQTVAEQYCRLYQLS